MMTMVTRLAVVLSAVVVAFAVAATPAAAKKAKDPGKKLYMTKTCIACHGRNGRKAMLDYPNLAGQDRIYMVNQVKDILKRKRTGSPDPTGNPRSEGMRGALVTPEGEHRITTDEIKAISAWLSKLEPAKPVPPETPVDPAHVEKGAKLYKKLKCRTCHGPDGRKPLKGYPYIAGQKRAYIITQLKDIRDKARTNGKSKMMYPNVRKASDQQIERLADYLSQIDRTAK